MQMCGSISLYDLTGRLIFRRKTRHPRCSLKLCRLIGSQWVHSGLLVVIRGEVRHVINTDHQLIVLVLLLVVVVIVLLPEAERVRAARTQEDRDRPENVASGFENSSRSLVTLLGSPRQTCVRTDSNKLTARETRVRRAREREALARTRTTELK